MLTHQQTGGANTVPLRPVASFHHRAHVHPVTRGDCLECLPAPCVCGSYLCPQAFEHHREHAGSETTWRLAVAR